MSSAGCNGGCNAGCNEAVVVLRCSVVHRVCRMLRVAFCTALDQRCSVTSGPCRAVRLRYMQERAQAEEKERAEVTAAPCRARTAENQFWLRLRLRSPLCAGSAQRAAEARIHRQAGLARALRSVQSRCSSLAAASCAASGRVDGIGKPWITLSCCFALHRCLAAAGAASLRAARCRGA